MNKEISFPELPTEDMHAEHTSNTLDADKVTYTELTKEELIEELKIVDDMRIWRIAEAKRKV